MPAYPPYGVIRKQQNYCTNGGNYGSVVASISCVRRGRPSGSKRCMETCFKAAAPPEPETKPKKPAKGAKTAKNSGKKIKPVRKAAAKPAAEH